jgi:hypothetical protein
MSFSFAGISNVTADQLDLVERILVTLSALGDPAKLKANGEALKRAQTESLAALERAAAAERSLAEVTARQERQAAELTAREQAVTDRENKLLAREQVIAAREENWQQAVAAVRGIAA